MSLFERFPNGLVSYPGIIQGSILALAFRQVIGSLPIGHGIAGPSVLFLHLHATALLKRRQEAILSLRAEELVNTEVVLQRKQLLSEDLGQVDFDIVTD